VTLVSHDRVFNNANMTYMKSKPGVWFATCEQIARYVKDAAGSDVSR
jgi:hypothetical protein